MDIEFLRQECLRLPGTREDMPFGDSTLVLKVSDKMFALISLDQFPPSMNLKCEPLRAIELRERYASIIPGYHMNKKHWNTLQFNGELSVDLVRELIRHSYDLVVQGLPKNRQEALRSK